MVMKIKREPEAERSVPEGMQPKGPEAKRNVLAPSTTQDLHVSSSSVIESREEPKALCRSATPTSAGYGPSTDSLPTLGPKTRCECSAPSTVSASSTIGPRPTERVSGCWPAGGPPVSPAAGPSGQPPADRLGRAAGPSGQPPADGLGRAACPSGQPPADGLGGPAGVSPAAGPSGQPPADGLGGPAGVSPAAGPSGQPRADGLGGPAGVSPAAGPSGQPPADGLGGPAGVSPAAGPSGQPRLTDWAAQLVCRTASGRAAVTTTGTGSSCPPRRS